MHIISFRLKKNLVQPCLLQKTHEIFIYFLIRFSKGTFILQKPEMQFCNLQAAVEYKIYKWQIFLYRINSNKHFRKYYSKSLV